MLDIVCFIFNNRHLHFKLEFNVLHKKVALRHFINFRPYNLKENKIVLHLNKYNSKFTVKLFCTCIVCEMNTLL